MRVHIELTAQATADGLRALAFEWQNNFPQASFCGLTSYSGLTLMLRMPEQTTVTPPQLIDATGGTVEEP